MEERLQGAQPLSPWQRLRDAICSDPVRITAVLSLLLVLLHGYSEIYSPLFAPALAFALVPLVFFPRLLQSPLLWGWLSLAAGLTLYRYWYLADNHKILLGYWLLALTLAFCLRGGERRGFVEGSARFLLVFTFGAAALQKSLDASYMRSEFFEFTMLYDARFELLLRLFGVERELLIDNRAVIDGVARAGFTAAATNPVAVESSARIRLLADLVTWWDLGVQVWIAVLFALRRRLADVLAHAGLVAFIFSTYFFAPVIGFGWTIAIWGYAMSARTLPVLAVGYIALLQVLTVYDLPWNGVLRLLGF